MGAHTDAFGLLSENTQISHQHSMFVPGNTNSVYLRVFAGISVFFFSFFQNDDVNMEKPGDPIGNSVRLAGRDLGLFFSTWIKLPYLKPFCDGLNAPPKL